MSKTVETFEQVINQVVIEWARINGIKPLIDPEDGLCDDAPCSTLRTFLLHKLTPIIALDKATALEAAKREALESLLPKRPDESLPIGLHRSDEWRNGFIKGKNNQVARVKAAIKQLSQGEKLGGGDGK